MTTIEEKLLALRVIQIARILGVTKAATEQEEQIIARSRPGRSTRDQRGLIEDFESDHAELAKALEADMMDFFAKMGGRLASIALDHLEPKDALSDELMVDAIMRDLDDGGLRDEITEVGQAHYLRVATKTFDTVKGRIGIAVDLPDDRARAIVSEGGRRLGLIDLNDSTKRRLFKELTEGRSLGEGPVSLARRIREDVPAGRWRDAKTRAEIIARTETMHAQRMSALESYKAGAVETVIVFDNRTGHGDAECTALDQMEVSIDDAWTLMEAEHVNGTRSFSAVI